MTRLATHSATARDIIRELVRNMREGLEPLEYSTLAPAIYHVYLHADDLDRLRGLIPRIVDEARRALDAELSILNRTPLSNQLSNKLKLSRKAAPKVEAPPGGWMIDILENTDDETQPGDIVIYSELALPAKPDYGTGSMTKRIATSRLGGELKTAQKYEEKPAGAPETYATLAYEDNKGPQSYRMTKNQIVIGRGGRDYWTDLTLETLPDVSREHIRLRRDPATGKFFVKDLSRLGTTIDGRKIPSSVEYAGDEKKDKNLEVDLPPRARIGLADVVFLDFQAGGE
ncbi:MAG TPA: FHA domain-containing protein [Bryobacteraceae bacterium]|nr:FHA domain-containing protein [Bryobacteraceae bacterium]